MSLDNPEAAADEGGGQRRISLWFLVVPIVLTIVAASLAFFLLSPRDEDLTATVDQTVANAEPAKPAFTAPPSSPTAATQ